MGVIYTRMMEYERGQALKELVFFCHMEKGKERGIHMVNFLMISDAAKEVQVESHVLRYWEEELHLPIHRNELGHRYYTKEDVERFKQIKGMKERGLQLKAIKMILKDGKIDVMLPEDEKEALKRQEEERDRQARQERGEEGESGETAYNGGKTEAGAVGSDGGNTNVALNVAEREERGMVAESREEKARRLQWLLQQLIRDTLQENNKELSREIRESVVKELDYQFRMQEERDEERDHKREERDELHYQKLDELLRRKSRRLKASGRGERPDVGERKTREDDSLAMTQKARTAELRKSRQERREEKKRARAEKRLLAEEQARVKVQAREEEKARQKEQAQKAKEEALARAEEKAKEKEAAKKKEQEEAKAREEAKLMEKERVKAEARERAEAKIREREEAKEKKKEQEEAKAKARKEAKAKEREEIRAKEEAKARERAESLEIGGKRKHKKAQISAESIEAKKARMRAAVKADDQKREINAEEDVEDYESLNDEIDTYKVIDMPQKNKRKRHFRR